MKFVFSVLLSTLTLASTSAHAFMTADEHARLIGALNQTYSGKIHFEEFRCSLRSRACLVKLDLIESHSKTSCLIEHISDSSDIVSESVAADGKSTTQLANYSRLAINECLAKNSR